jgi:hypothetical protein
LLKSRDNLDLILDAKLERIEIINNKPVLLDGLVAHIGNNYSYRNASIGFNRAAFIAGYQPKKLRRLLLLQK